MSTPDPVSLPHAGSLRVEIIEPRRGWASVDFGELWRCRELLVFLVWRDIKVRYKQTVLGAAWAIIHPVFMMAVFSLIFSRLLGVKPAQDIPYPLFVYAALLPWSLLQTSVSMASMSLVGQQHLLTKIYMPRLFIPAASIGTCLVDFALGFLVYLGLMLYYWQLPGVTILLVPVFTLLTVLTAMGVSLLLSSLTITYRDFRHVLPFLLQTWMYLTPVVYPVDKIPEKLRLVMALNPMYGIIQGFRSVLWAKPIDWLSIGIGFPVTVLLLVVGAHVFRQMERRFADVA